MHMSGRGLALVSVLRLCPDRPARGPPGEPARGPLGGPARGLQVHARPGLGLKPDGYSTLRRTARSSMDGVRVRGVGAGGGADEGTRGPGSVAAGKALSSQALPGPRCGAAAPARVRRHRPLLPRHCERPPPPLGLRYSAAAGQCVGEMASGQMKSGQAAPAKCCPVCSHRIPETPKF